MKKILMTVKPFVNFSPTNDALLSVLQLEPSLYPSIMENFIDIYHWNIGTLKEWPFVEFYCSKFYTEFDCLSIMHIKRELALLSDIVEYVKTAIDHDYYVLMEIDMYYNQNYLCYQRHSERHEIFIYGYDEEKQVFHTADYFNGDYFIHRPSDFQQLADSFIFNKHHNALNGFILFKKREDFSRGFNFNKVYISLKQLLNPVHFEKDLSSRYYGFMYFEELKEIMLSLTWEDDFRIARLTHFLLCHVKLMNMRLKYLYEQLKEPRFQPVQEAAEALYQKSIILRNKALKYDLLRRESFPKRLLESIQVEYEIILEIYQKIIIDTIIIFETLNKKFDKEEYRYHA